MKSLGYNFIAVVTAFMALTFSSVHASPPQSQPPAPQPTPTVTVSGDVSSGATNNNGNTWGSLGKVLLVAAAIAVVAAVAVVVGVVAVGTGILVAGVAAAVALVGWVCGLW